MTNGQSASLSWNKATIWGLRPGFYYFQTVACLLMWDTLSDERTICRLQLLLASPAQSFSGRSPVGLATIFYCLRFETSFSSPPTTRWPTLKVFDPASTRESLHFKVKVMLGPMVQSASLSSKKASIWGLGPDLYYCLTVAVLLMWGALSDERMGLSFARLSQQ
jgi:hypothetical protein